jgi:hypothetical protein
MKIKDIVLKETEITTEPMPGAQQLKVDGKPIGTADQATADIMKQAQEKGTLNLGGDEQQTSEGGDDIGGDGTGAFINDVRDAEAEAAMGYGPEGGEAPLDEFLGLGNKSPEEWAKVSPQMAKLLQFRAKAVGTPYEKQVEQRIQLLKDRLDMDAGEVAGKDGMPKDPVPPEQFDMKQLREADDDLLNKMRAIAGLR